MKRLIHNDLQQMEMLFDLFNKLHDKYVQKDISFFQGLASALEKAYTLYEEIGLQDKCNMLKSLKSHLNTCNRGYDPYALQKIEQNKKETQYLIAFKVLKNAELLLQDEYTKLSLKLEEAKPLLESIVLSAIQIGILDSRNYNQGTIELAWKQIASEPNFDVLQKKAILTCSYYDALILIARILEQLNVSK